MTKRISVKYWVASISSCVVATGILLACAGDWGEEYGTSNFTPQIIIKDTTYSPFFYSQNFYYEIGHDDNHDRRFNDQNTKDWSAWLGAELPANQLNFLLRDATAASVDSAAKIKGSARRTAFLAYLRLAKTAETFALNNISGPWEYEEKKNSRRHIDGVAFDKALLKAAAGADPFLKPRYFFQRVRNLYFNGKPGEAVALFDQSEKEYTHDNSYYRAMAYAAGDLYAQKNYSKANYYYSKVYDGCPALRTVAHYSFHPQQQTDWQATLARCTSSSEKATCWQMLGVFYSDEPRSIREIYQLDPKSDKMELLLVRAVNIYEQRFGEMSSRSDTAGRAAYEIITRIAREGKTARPWVWTMAAGYLNTLNGKYAEARKYYDNADVPKDKHTRDQLRLLKLINTLGATKKLDAHTEDQLYPDLEWLTGLHGIRSADALAWMRRRMAQLYSAQGDAVRSECFVSTSKFYADDKQVLALHSFLNKPSKTPYENYCAGICHIRPADISEYRSIQKAYAGDIDGAIATIARDSAGGAFTILPGNPFNGRIRDCHDCDFAATQKIKYSKLSFLQKLKEMKDKVAAGNDVYTNTVLLGNAYYNMSHYGNARTFYECAVIGSGHSDPGYIDSAFRKMLVSNTMAAKYYTQALGAATTNEQKAKCQYMLAKCQRNEWYNKIAGQDETHIDFLAWPGFVALNQYSNTQYYKDVLRECGYFSSYAQKNPPVKQ